MTNTKPIVKLYTRVPCPLCDEAKKILIVLQSQFTFQLEEVDIYSDDHLVEKYGLMIPVVEVDGEEVQYGKIDQQKLTHYLLRQQQTSI